MAPRLEGQKRINNDGCIIVTGVSRGNVYTDMPYISSGVGSKKYQMARREVAFPFGPIKRAIR